MKKILFLLFFTAFCGSAYAQELLKARSNMFNFKIEGKAAEAIVDKAENKNIAEPQDNQKPTLELSVPSQSKKNVLVLEGKVTDKGEIKEILIDGKQIGFVPKTGEFTHHLSLTEGKNTFTISAKDMAGNTETQSYSVVYLPEKQRVKDKDKNGVSLPLIEADGKNFILAFACQKYQHEGEMNSLNKPITDATEVIKTLTSLYAFDNKQVIFKKNPTRSEIIEAMDSMVNVLSAKDNLLIFYAGHAYYDSDLKKGYWLPVDSKSTSRANWFSNDDLRTYIGTFKTKHTLLIADACFSGSILRDMKAQIMQSSHEFQRLYGMPSRKAMTSGTMKPVPDESVFIKYLVKYLVGNTDKYMTADHLFHSFRETVIKNSPNYQVPQYGDIHEAGDEGGEFIFIKK